MLLPSVSPKPCSLVLCLVRQRSAKVGVHCMLRASETSDGVALLSAIGEIIEECDAVRLGPHADLARVFEALVTGFDHFLSIERHRELIAFEVRAQRVP